MSQEIFNDIDPSSTSGTQLATLLNEFKDAYSSGNSGDTSRPANLQANGSWIKYNDPDNGLLTWYLYDGTQDIELFQINKSTANIILSNSEDEFNIIKNSDDALGPEVNLKKGRIAGGGQTVLNDVIGNIKWVGRDGSAVEYTQAQITTTALENVTSGAHGAEVAFYVTQTGTSSLVKAVTITNDKKLGVGVTDPTQMVEAYAEDSTAGFKATISEDSTTGASMTVRKKRVTGSGQVLSGDTVGNFEALSTDNAGAEIDSANIKAVAAENHTATAGGTTLVIQRVKTGETALTDIVTIAEDLITLDDNVTVTGDLTVDTGSTTTVEELQVNQDLTVTGDLTVNGTTTTIDTTNLVVEDNNIVINNGGDDASSEGAGLTVERTGTDGSLIYADALASKFKAGALGSEKELVNVDSAQDVENKAIITPSRLDVKQGTAAALETYALTADDGQFVFATDTQKMYQVIDNTLADVGGGAGGTLDTVLAESFEETSSTDFSTGNNATFLGGGTIDGALSDEETTPMAGTRSIKYTMGSSSANDYVASTAVGIDLKEAGNIVGVNFYYTYNGDDDDIKFVVYDVDNTTVLSSSLDLVKAASNPTRYSTSVLIPTGVTELKYGFQVVTGNNGKILEFDDVQISTNPFVYKDILETQVYRLSQATNAMTNTNAEVEFNLGTATISNTGPNIVEAQDDSANTRTKYVAQKKCKVDFSWFGPIGTASRALSIFKNDTLVTAGTSVYVSNRDGGVSGSTELEAGEYVTLAVSVNGSKDNSDLTSGADLTTVSFVATAATEHVVTPTEVGSQIAKMTGFTSVNGSSQVKFATETYNYDSDGVDNDVFFSIDNSGTFTKYTALQNCYFDIGIGMRVDSGGAIAGFARYDSSDTQVENWRLDAGTTGITNAAIGIPIRMLAGDYITALFYGTTLSNVSSETYMHVKATPLKANFLAAIPVQLTAYVKDVKSNTTAGGIATGATWVASTLNTVSGDSEIVSLSSNRVLLSTGKYEISASRPFCGVGSCRIRLYDYTNSAVVELGSTGYESNGVTNSYSMLETSLEVTTATEYQLEYWATSGGNSYDLGNASSCGSDEVYAQVKITKNK